MEITIISKLFVALISAVGAIAAFKLNSMQSKKTKAELIKQFEEDLENQNKYSICELFSVIYGITMDYEDILEIVKRSDLNRVLYALKKTPGMIKYEKGKLQYNTVYKNKWYRLIERNFTKFITYISGTLVLLILFLLMPFVKGTLALIFLGFAVIFFTFFALHWREMWYNNMLRDLIKKEER